VLDFVDGLPKPHAALLDVIQLLQREYHNRWRRDRWSGYRITPASLMCRGG
jgi:hypothetical protein